MRLCDCHGLPMDSRQRLGRTDHECAENRRARQRAYVERRNEEFVYRASESLRKRRYHALRRRAARARRESTG